MLLIYIYLIYEQEEIDRSKERKSLIDSYLILETTIINISPLSSSLIDIWFSRLRF